MGKSTSATSTTLSNSDAKRLKSKKSQKALVSDNAGASTSMPAVTEAEGRDPSDISNKKESKKRALEEPEASADAPLSVESPKKEKKRKRKEREQRETTRLKETEEVLEEPPKKKRKNRTEFADPRADASLNGQSRKALEYAFTQMNKPTKWKFNKARQNWIIRNMWSPDTLPEAYFPLALKYLVKIQGGSRQKLKETAESYLNPKEDTTAANSATAHAEPSDQPDATPKPKPKPTPGVLIALGPTPGILVPASSTSESVTAPGATNKVAELTLVRAQQVLDMLSAADADGS